jgi:hypothetical protein
MPKWRRAHDRHNYHFCQWFHTQHCWGSFINCQGCDCGCLVRSLCTFSNCSHEACQSHPSTSRLEFKGNSIINCVQNSLHWESRGKSETEGILERQFAKRHLIWSGWIGCLEFCTHGVLKNHCTGCKRSKKDCTNTVHPHQHITHNWLHHPHGWQVSSRRVGWEDCHQRALSHRFFWGPGFGHGHASENTEATSCLGCHIWSIYQGFKISWWAVICTDSLYLGRLDTIKNEFHDLNLQHSVKQQSYFVSMAWMQYLFLAQFVVLSAGTILLSYRLGAKPHDDASWSTTWSTVVPQFLPMHCQGMESRRMESMLLGLCSQCLLITWWCIGTHGL